MKRILIFVLLVLCPVIASANGFFLYEASPASIAQGGAVIAAGNEPAAVFANPASMTRLDRFNFSLNLNMYLSDSEFKSEATGKSNQADTALFPTPSFFATYKAHKWVSAGIGTYAAYGLGISWPEKWEGYHLVKSSELQSYSIQPSIAIGSFYGVSVGAGFDIVLGAVRVEQGIPFGDGIYAKMRLGGTTVGYGNNVGIMYEPTKWIRIGAHYRSQVLMKLDEGKVDFDNVPAPFASTLKDQKVRTGLILPQVVGVGIRAMPITNLEIELDALQVYWSSYKQLSFEFEDTSLNKVQEKKWEDSPQFRLGAQYKYKKWDFRAGIIYDINPIPDDTLDPMLPDNERIDYCIGAGYSFGKFRLDASYMFVNILERTVKADKNPFPGTYDAAVNSFAIGFSGSL